MTTAWSTQKAALASVLGAIALLAVTSGTIAIVRADFALEENAGLAEFGSSALQFGFDENHSGAQRAPLSVESYSKKRAFYPSKAIKAEMPMPLYVNGESGPSSPFYGKQVLIIGARKKLLAWDVLENRVVWKVSNLPGELFSTPLLDAEFARIYFLTSKWTRNPDPVPKQAVFTIQNWVHSIDIDGKDLHSIEIPSREFLAHEEDEITHDPRSFSMCKTAIGLNRKVTPNYIFFGCSMLTEAGFDLHYGHMKGSRGLLFAIRLDSDFHITENGIRAFSPSRPTENPHTGFDTGIYNVGAGPVVLEDGSLIFATGNGPFFPRIGNYGCSVVRINGSTLQPDDVRDEHYEYYSLEDGEYDECHGANLDMGSSSVVTISANGRTYAAVTGKDGTAKSFDPFNLPGQDRSRKHEYHLGGSAHGQPAIWETAAGEIVINVVGRKEFPARLERESVIATAGVRASLRNNYESLGCIGLVATEPGPGRLPLKLYYSGPYRNDYVNFANTNVSVAHQYVERDPLQYRYESAAGWIAGDAAVKGPAGYRTQVLNLYGSSNPHYHRNVGYFNATPDLAAGHYPENVRIVEKTGYVFVDEGAGDCGSYQGTDFERVFLLSRAVSYEKRTLFASFTINSDYSLTKRWVHYAEEGYEPHQVGPLVVLPHNSDETPLMVFAIAAVGSSMVDSKLIVANAISGEVLDTIPFTGQPKSTMPLVVGDDIVVTTHNHGLIFFADGRSKFDQLATAVAPRFIARVRNRLSR